ncbi:hypothetical protein [Actinomadura macrotermitis]|uniref:Uncharacterized protein n=1 Tax=Actinomadura macrotermitis TaxID=2585200 RepID=A0A7K0C3P6_9ACTN|nr:hypothetical protein [Actinomadura macrotermitis]MQY08069.1 hypothetical protein [Actinomadura macrotermitis]
MSGWHSDDSPADGEVEPLTPVFGPANDGSSVWFPGPDALDPAHTPGDSRVFGWADTAPAPAAVQTVRPFPEPARPAPAAFPSIRKDFASPRRRRKKRRSAAALSGVLCTLLVIGGGVCLLWLL